ncbi:unnamed protein product [Trifolium pratense]|uniref:Uncharacterized protein n=1 Tax=Trifolium pratense TaxID=57577 RepID=A0ACB0IXV4_TRIPR|nr:unnamed protein product [Trifolium pratense]
MPPPLLLPPFSFIINIFLFLSLFFLIPIHVTSDGERYKSCAPFSCGNFTNISYPFWRVDKQPSYCGHPNFKLDCENLTIEIKSQKFRIIDINQTSQLLRIARMDLWSYDHDGIIASCPKKYINVTLDLNFFAYTTNYEKYTLLYECNPIPSNSYIPATSLSSEASQVISCLIEGEPSDAYLVSRAKVVDFMVLECKNNITVPGLKNPIIAKVLDEGFEVKWSGVEENICDGCLKSGGRCGHNAFENAIACLCPNQQSYGDCGFCRAGILLDGSDCKKPKKLFKSLAPSPLAAPLDGLRPSRALVPHPSSMYSSISRYVIRFF